MKPVSAKDMLRAKTVMDAAKHQAYGPAHDVGGQMLCWSGRMTLAMQKGSEAMQTDDAETLAAINEGVGLISAASKADHESAQRVEGAYVELHVQQGKTSELPAVECNCAGCIVAKAQDEAREQLHKIRKSTAALLFPDKERGTSLIVELTDGVNEPDNKGLLWGLVKTIARAQKEYVVALDVLGENPQWERVLT
jgi:hypothetical protein